MLTVLSPDEALSLISGRVKVLKDTQRLTLGEAAGRVLAEDVCAGEYVPGFDRSTVDGYAIRASDSFGCSESIPALFELSRSIGMGEQAGEEIPAGCCAYVPTGAALPPGTDAVAMIEYCEAFGDGTIALSKPAAPGENIIFKGDDVYPGKVLLHAGRRISGRDVGALAAMGITELSLRREPLVGIISTGDELVEAAQQPGEGQIRDSNSPMLAAMVQEMGCRSRVYGIVRDEETLLEETLDRALEDCDCVLVSGGSSVGNKDATAKVIASRGELLFHGLAMKPGKPTIMGMAGDKPIFGLPGHPGAACYVAELFVRRAVDCLLGRRSRPLTLSARLSESISANHGRAQYCGVVLDREEGGWTAHPIRSKSGLMSAFSAADGYICIPRDREGYAGGETVQVTLYSTYQEE